MGKIDTSGWKEFRVGELFEKLNLRFLPNRVFDKASDISEVKSEEFNLPLVNAKHSNNGIMYYGRKHEWEYEVLTIDIVADGAASTGDVYAQPQETGVLYNAYLVKPKAKCVTGLILFFLSTVIQRCVKDHFGYDNKCTWDKVKHETILLPVDKTGQPDWAYMESYMASLETKVTESLTLLQTAKDAEKKKVDTREWGEFRVGELFKTQMKGKKIQVPTGANVPMQDMIKDGSTPRITVTGVNNGVFGLYDYCGKNSTEYRVFRNFISVSFLGTVFYQEGEATLDMKVHCLQPNHITLNKYTGNFLVSAIKASLRESSYSDQISSTILPEMTIMLPKDKTGQPDWAYMEEYMRKVEEKTENTLNQFMLV